MAQSSQALKQFMTFCCGDSALKCFSPLSVVLGERLRTKQMIYVTLNCSACSLACMFLCAACRCSNICGNCASKLQRIDIFLSHQINKNK